MSRIPIGSLLRHHGELKPEGVVAIASGSLSERSTITWRDLEKRSNQRAAQLRALGVGHDDLVTVALANGIAFFETTFAIWKAGATPNVVSPNLPVAEFRAIVETARPKLIVTSSTEIPDGWPILPADASLQGFADTATDAEPATYFKAMTSGGSTGRPKIIIDHTPASWDPAEPVIMQPRGGTVLNPGPLYHNGPFLFSHAALFVGARVSSLVRFDAEESLRLIEHDGVQWAAFVPTMMKRIIDLPAPLRLSMNMTTLRFVWHMGAAVSPALKEKWIDWLGPERIFEAYSATEAVGGTVICGSEWLTKRGSVGRPMAGSQVKVVAEDGKPAAPGELGEIFMLPASGAGSTYHYLGEDRRADSAGWESVGDIGWLDADGYLFLADRRSDLIVRGGANIYPAEIEHALEQHPGVAAAVVIGLPDEDLGQRVHAIVEPRPGHSPSEDALRDQAAQLLSRFKHPASYEFVDGHLRDEAGKVRRSRLLAERVK